MPTLSELSDTRWRLGGHRAKSVVIGSYGDRMTPWTAAALGVLVGAILGALLLILIRGQRNESPAESGETPDPLPAGVTEVLDALSTGGLVVDSTGRALTSTSAARAYGLVHGPNLVHSELKQLAREVSADGQTRETELDLARGPFGQGRLLAGVRAALLPDGLVLMLVEDHTQARRVEEARRDFVVNVSHELKTPVGGLSLLAEAVAEANEDPEAVKRFAKRMQRETKRLSRLVSEIVNLSRLQTADLMNPLVIVDVSACAREAADDTRLVASKRRISAVCATPSAGLRVYGDAELISTAIRNLVTNAVAYSADGTRISVVSRRVDDTVEVAVSDQGSGIPERDLERIFERFYRVDPARSRATGGTGLGLSIVKHIASNHGGEVVVWSQEGHGSTFTLRLPGIVNDDREVGAAAPPHSRPGVTLVPSAEVGADPNRTSSQLTSVVPLSPGRKMNR